LFFAVSKHSQKMHKPDKEFAKDDWEVISKLIPGRSADQCDYKWSMIREPKSKKNAWSKEENDVLEALVGNTEQPIWKNIALEFNLRMLKEQKRTSKQCRERWINNMDAHIDRSKWKASEDLAIVKEVATNGKRWASMRKRIPGRTEMAVKNRYYTLLRQHKRDLQIKEKASSKSTFFEIALNGIIHNKKEVIERHLLQSILSHLRSQVEGSPKNAHLAIINHTNFKDQVTCEISQIRRKSGIQVLDEPQMSECSESSCFQAMS